jgi:hypothetical protein
LRNRLAELNAPLLALLGIHRNALYEIIGRGTTSPETAARIKSLLASRLASAWQGNRSRYRQDPDDPADRQLLAADLRNKPPMIATKLAVAVLHGGTGCGGLVIQPHRLDHLGCRPGPTRWRQPPQGAFEKLFLITVPATLPGMDAAPVPSGVANKPLDGKLL